MYIVKIGALLIAGGATYLGKGVADWLRGIEDAEITIIVGAVLLVAGLIVYPCARKSYIRQENYRMGYEANQRAKARAYNRFRQRQLRKMRKMMKKNQPLYGAEPDVMNLYRTAQRTSGLQCPVCGMPLAPQTRVCPNCSSPVNVYPNAQTRYPGR